jgi:hypothetical protein
MDTYRTADMDDAEPLVFNQAPHRSATELQDFGYFGNRK